MPETAGHQGIELPGGISAVTSQLRHISLHSQAVKTAAQAAQESAALSFEPQPQPDEEFNIQHLDDYDDESKSAVLKKEIKDFSRTNPDVVAQLIRSMMKNGE